MLGDFGFNHFHGSHNHSQILGIFIALVTRLDVRDRSLHRWQRTRTLKENIIKTFSTLPKNLRGGYYPWFLKHDWILEPPGEELKSDLWEKTKQSATVLLGVEDSGIPIEELQPLEKRYNLTFYGLLQNGHRPPPEEPTWISLGFCKCRDKWAESRRAGMCRQLISKCSFREFWEAMNTSTMLSLLYKNDLGKTPRASRHFESLISDT